MMRQLPIRLRLTLWYSVMFATAALLLSSTSWWMLRRTIDATTRQDLQEILAMGAAGKIQCEVATQPLSQANEVLEQLRRGKVSGRLVLSISP